MRTTESFKYSNERSHSHLHMASYGSKTTAGRCVQRGKDSFRPLGLIRAHLIDCIPPVGSSWSCSFVCYVFSPSECLQIRPSLIQMFGCQRSKVTTTSHPSHSQCFSWNTLRFNIWKKRPAGLKAELMGIWW